MSKSFSHSSLGRDMPPHSRREPPRMGLGSPNQSAGFGRSGPGPSRLDNMMGSQRSSGSSSQGIPSIFRLGNRGPAQTSRDDHSSRILASFGLSSSDLDELSRFPEDKITAENLPDIIQHLKRKRSEHIEMLSSRERLSRDSLRPSSDNWDDLRPLRRSSFDDRPGLSSVGDYGRSDSSRELSFRDRLPIDEPLRDRERHRDDRFLSEQPFRKSESDFDRLGYSSLQERSRSRGVPSGRNVDDFHGLPPKAFPHLCSLCDLPVNNFQGWDEHITGRLHKRQCLLLLDLYPDWNGRGVNPDPFMVPHSTNPAPGILGPPPPPMPMGGGPGPRHGNFRGPPGNCEVLHLLGGNGRVVHLVNFERGKTLKQQLFALVERFGEITNHLILNNINEAYIEMATSAQANDAVDYYEMNPAYVYGKPINVFLSQKYKRIRKDEEKPLRREPEKEPKRESKGDSKDSSTNGACVLRICNLPQSGYTDTAIIKLAETYGKVKNYILMRKRSQAFIEMEKPEDAKCMIDRCNKSPLFFQGRALTVGISEKYKTLVLRIPNSGEESDKDKKSSRKRGHSPDGKDGKEKQRKSEGGEAELVTTEETETGEEADQRELVSGSCEQELDEEVEEDDDEGVGEEEAAALLETSGSGDEADIPDDTDGDQNKSQNEELESASTEEKNARAFHGNVKDFVTLDEIGDEENGGASRKKKGKAGRPAKKTSKTELNSVLASADEAERENEADQSDNTDTNLMESDAHTEEPATDVVVGPYQVNNPVGVDFVIPKTGFYCKLCSLFYTSEDVAKVTHCSTLAHYKKFKEYYSKDGKYTDKN
ncbi:matrin-3-like [Gastrophryne carolinensis]